MIDAHISAGGARWHGVAGSVALQSAAVRWVLDAAARAIAARDRFVVVLAGGSTPRGVYTHLRGADTDWSRWHIWFGDERCLPIADPDRNSAMACDTWLAHVAIPPQQIHAIAAELGAVDAARDYALSLRDVGEFDLVLLGLGEDGHTASLFPGQDWGIAADAADALAVHDAPKPPPQRVSLSAARLSRARAVLFLVEGESKRSAVKQWWDQDDIPARAIQPAAGIDVLVEASLLPPRNGND